MDTNRYELNKQLAQMLKGGVIMESPRRSRLRLPRRQARAPLWRWKKSLRISGLQAAYPG